MFKPKEISEPDVVEFEFDLQELTRKLDKVKSQAFIGDNSAFLAPLMCSMDFIWTMDIPTAATNGITFFWNPQWFLQLPPETRLTVLKHELWHPASLHGLRQGDREHEIWNWACDIRINNDLEDQGMVFTGTKPWLNQKYRGMIEEDIYDALIAQALAAPTNGSWGHVLPENLVLDDQPDMLHAPVGDMLPMTEEDEIAAVKNVVQATQQAHLAGKAGDVPSNVETIIKQFLTPIVPWEQEMLEFMNELSNFNPSWKRPSRRYISQGIYLPGRVEDRQGLQHLNYYWDVSGSVTDAIEVRFNSEVRYIKEYFNPRKLSLIQFDTRITSEETFEENDPFEEIKIIGRGGTNLHCVKEHINKSEPTAVIIFSDLYCAPMQKLDRDVPILWVVVNNPHAEIPFGRAIHIKC